jgi:hypothetical protein
MQTDWSLPQPENADSPIIKTDEGIQIDPREEQPEKASSPRIETRVGDSKVTFERASQPRKHAFEIPSIDDGIQIDRSDAQP